MVKPGDYMFDVGYSGRPESALSSLLGFPVGSLIALIAGLVRLQPGRYDAVVFLVTGCGRSKLHHAV